MVWGLPLELGPWGFLVTDYGKDFPDNAVCFNTGVKEKMSCGNSHHCSFWGTISMQHQDQLLIWRWLCSLTWIWHKHTRQSCQHSLLIYSIGFSWMRGRRIKSIGGAGKLLYIPLWRSISWYKQKNVISLLIQIYKAQRHLPEKFSSAADNGWHCKWIADNTYQYCGGLLFVNLC